MGERTSSRHHLADDTPHDCRPRAALSHRIGFLTDGYEQRHLIENAFCPLKAFPRITARYDRLARTSLPPSASSLLSYGRFYES